MVQGYSRAGGGLPSPPSRLRPAPAAALVVLPPDGVSTISVCARRWPTSGQRPHRLCPFSAAAAPACADGVVSGGQKPARPRRASLRPPVPAGRRRPWPAAGASSVVSRPCPVRAAVGRLRSRRPRRRPRPRRSARANKVGGLASVAKGHRAAGSGAPSAPAPPPVVGVWGGAFFVCPRGGVFGGGDWSFRRLVARGVRSAGQSPARLPPLSLSVAPASRY